MYAHQDADSATLTAVMLPAIVLFSSSFLASVVATTPASSTTAAAAADDCVIDLAIMCLDDKMLVYVNWLEKRDKLNVVGDIVTVVRKQPTVQPGLAQDRSKLQPTKNRRTSESLGPAIDEYFDTHTLRISLPWILDSDIDLELDQEGIVRSRLDLDY